MGIGFAGRSDLLQDWICSEVGSAARLNVLRDWISRDVETLGDWIFHVRFLMIGFVRRSQYTGRTHSLINEHDSESYSNLCAPKGPQHTVILPGDVNTERKRMLPTHYYPQRPNSRSTYKDTERPRTGLRLGCETTNRTHISAPHTQSEHIKQAHQISTQRKHMRQAHEAGAAT